MHHAALAAQLAARLSENGLAFEPVVAVRSDSRGTGLGHFATKAAVLTDAVSLLLCRSCSIGMADANLQTRSLRLTCLLRRRRRRRRRRFVATGVGLAARGGCRLFTHP